RFCTPTRRPRNRPTLAGLAAEVLSQLIGIEPTELSADSRLLENAHLEILRVYRALAVVCPAECRASEAQCIPEGWVRAVARGEVVAQLLFRAADHAEVPVIADAAVVLNPVDLVLLVADQPGITDLRDDHLDLERLELAREHVADRLRVGVRERATAH